MMSLANNACLSWRFNVNFTTDFFPISWSFCSLCMSCLRVTHWMRLDDVTETLLNNLRPTQRFKLTKLRYWCCLERRCKQVIVQGFFSVRSSDLMHEKTCRRLKKRVKHWHQMLLSHFRWRRNRHLETDAPSSKLKKYCNILLLN